MTSKQFPICEFCGRDVHPLEPTKAECRKWRGPRRDGGYYKEWHTPVQKVVNYSGMVVFGSIFVVALVIVVVLLAALTESMGL